MALQSAISVECINHTIDDLPPSLQKSNPVTLQILTFDRRFTPFSALPRRSKDPIELETWRNTHRCTKEEICKWCKETVHTLASPYEHRRAALFNDHSVDDVMSLKDFLEANRFVGVLAKDPPAGHQPAHEAHNDAVATCYRVMDRTALEKAFIEVAGCGSLRESVAGARIEYAQFRDAVASLDTILVDGPMKAHKKVCSLKPIRCDACKESYQPTRPGGAEKWLTVHKDKSCPLRPVTCKACELVFVPQVAGQIEEWMQAHPKVCRRSLHPQP